MGMSQGQMFDPLDLYERKNMMRVLVALEVRAPARAPHAPHARRTRHTRRAHTPRDRLTRRETTGHGAVR